MRPNNDGSKAVVKKPKLRSIAGWLSKGKIAVAVGKTVITGKPAKTFDRIQHGFEIGDKALEIAALVKLMLRKENAKD
jgi:hypothetical protein